MSTRENIRLIARASLYVSMPGKRLSLVCCWGPAAFHFPDGYVVIVLGEGRFALSSNLVCMAKLV